MTQKLRSDAMNLASVTLSAARVPACRDEGESKGPEDLSLTALLQGILTGLFPMEFGVLERTNTCFGPD